LVTARAYLSTTIEQIARRGLLAALVLAAACVGGSGAEARSHAPGARLSVRLVAGARTSPHPLLLTLGGPIYCGQLNGLAAKLNASLACADYPRNGYSGPGGRANRREDWGDPTYLAAVAKYPAELRRQGVKISKLVLVGVSYSGYANAELVATHPELDADALIVVDSYLDLTARYRALPGYHETRKEMVSVIGGTPEQVPGLYDARSPSHHLDGLARAVTGGMKLVVVWSVSPAERREFVGATCSLLANAQWLSELAGVLGRPVSGYVTQLPHAHALWSYGQSLLALASLAPAPRSLPAHEFTFRPGAPVPAGSDCGPAQVPLR
jgi:pimeloyl-ACP methyl ester carboxylesterase